MKIAFYSFNVVEKATKAANLASRVGEFLKGIGIPMIPMVTVVQPSPVSNPDQIYLALADGRAERTAIGKLDPMTKKRVGYRQEVKVVFHGGGYLHLEDEDDGFEVKGSQICSMGRYKLPICTVNYGEVIKEVGILVDGQWHVSDTQVTSMTWEEVPKGISETAALVLG